LLLTSLVLAQVASKTFPLICLIEYDASFDTQAEQLPAPELENVPGLHARHPELDVVPAFGEYVPAGQDEHVVELE